MPLLHVGRTLAASGYLITLCHKDVLQRGVPGSYHVLDWRSFKLPRVARSTLSAEGQAAAGAADAVYLPRSREAHGVEVMATKDRMLESGTKPQADGLTKESAMQLLADRLRTHCNRLVADVSYEAARKKDPSKRHASAVDFALCVSCITPAAASPLDSGAIFLPFFRLDSAVRDQAVSTEPPPARNAAILAVPLLSDQETWTGSLPGARHVGLQVTPRQRHVHKLPKVIQ